MQWLDNRLYVDIMWTIIVIAAYLQQILIPPASHSPSLTPLKVPTINQILEEKISHKTKRHKVESTLDTFTIMEIRTH